MPRLISWNPAAMIAVLAIIFSVSPLRAQATAGNAAIRHGRYLVKAGDCAACHTADGGKPFAGGRAVPTPFGIIYSTNITPDEDTGIGKWNDADFYRAMHYGVDRAGNHLYPAFPYPWYTKITPADVHDIKSYLDTLQPVRQVNRSTKLPWPMNQRGTMALWNKMYFDPGTFVPDPKQSEQWNRGAYLVRGLEHCGACHTDKNFAGAPNKDKPLQGGFGENAFAPSLTGGKRDGLGAWSVAEIVEYLKTGSNEKSSAAGPMAEVVSQSTQYLSDDDLTAIATFLKSAPAGKEDDKSNNADANVMKRGEETYVDNCSACHMDAGRGLAHAFPPLQGSSAVQAAKPDTLIRVVLGGAAIPSTTSKPTGMQMPEFATKLDDAQIAAVVTYIRNAWGNHASSVDADAITDMRKQMKQPGG